MDAKQLVHAIFMQKGDSIITLRLTAQDIMHDIESDDVKLMTYPFILHDNGDIFEAIHTDPSRDNLSFPIHKKEMMYLIKQELNEIYNTALEGN